MSKSKILVSSLIPFGVDVEGLDPNSVVERKGFVPEIKIMDGEERIHDRKSFGCSGSKKQLLKAT